jgi:hypothetical protein
MARPVPAAAPSLPQNFIRIRLNRTFIIIEQNEMTASNEVRPMAWIKIETGTTNILTAIPVARNIKT